MNISITSDIFYNVSADALLCCYEAYEPDGGALCEMIYQAAPGLKDEARINDISSVFAPVCCSPHGLPYKCVLHLDTPLRLGKTSEKHLQEVYRSAFELVPELGLKSLSVPLDSDAPDYESRLRIVTDAAFQLARHRNVDFELKIVSKGLSREFILTMEKDLSPLCDTIDDTAFGTTSHTEFIRQLVVDELKSHGWNDITFYRKANIGAVELVCIRNREELDFSLYSLMNLLVGLRPPYEQFCGILLNEFGVDCTRNLPAAVVAYFLEKNIYDLSLIDRGLDVFELPHIGNALRVHFLTEREKESDFPVF